MVFGGSVLYRRIGAEPVMLANPSIPLREFKAVCSVFPDSNRDGYVDASEVYNACIMPEYFARIDSLNAALFSECAPTIDLPDAFRRASDVADSMHPLIVSLASLFGENAEGAMNLFNFGVSSQLLSEKWVTLATAARKGTGQIGISWRTSDGTISVVRPGSTGEAAGLMTGDRILRVGDIEFFGEKSTELIMDELFGPCGDIVEVEVMRGDNRMLFEVVKGAN